MCLCWSASLAVPGCILSQRVCVWFVRGVPGSALLYEQLLGWCLGLFGWVLLSPDTVCTIEALCTEGLQSWSLFAVIKLVNFMFVSVWLMLVSSVQTTACSAMTGSTAQYTLSATLTMLLSACSMPRAVMRPENVQSTPSRPLSLR